MAFPGRFNRSIIRVVEPETSNHDSPSPPPPPPHHNYNKPLINSSINPTDTNENNDSMDTDYPAAAAAAMTTTTSSFPSIVSRRLDDIDTDAAIARQLQEDEYSRNSFAQNFRPTYTRPSASTTSKSSTRKELTDAEYAAQLQEEEERNQRRHGQRSYIRPPQTRASTRRDPPVVIPTPPSASGSSRHQQRRSSSDDNPTENPLDMSSFWRLLGPMVHENFGPRRAHGAHDLENTEDDFGPDDYENLLELDNAVPVTCLTEAEINRLPIERFQRRATNNEEDNKCNVCWDEFKINDTLRRLKCLHTYHKDCIDPWLKTNSSCPICRVSTK